MGKMYSFCNFFIAELTSLTLWTKGLATDTDGQTSLISDVLFNHGFLKMPKLHRLVFSGRFQVGLGHLV